MSNNYDKITPEEFGEMETATKTSMVNALTSPSWRFTRRSRPIWWASYGTVMMW